MSMHATTEPELPSVVAAAVRRRRGAVWRVTIATAAAVLALASARELWLAPALGLASEALVQAEPDPLARLLVDDHAREQADRDRALRTLGELRIGAQALALVRRRYVEPARIRPPAMLLGALDALSHAVPPLLIDPDGARPGHVTLGLGAARHTVALSFVSDLYRLDRALQAILRFVAPRLPPDLPAADLEYLAINGALQTLDPHSRMLDPDAWRAMRAHTGGQFGGLGIRILVQQGVLTVVGVLKDSPAARAGIAERDVIAQIDGQDTLNMAVTDAVERLRGEVGSKVQLQVRRQGWPQPRSFVLARDTIRVESVEHRLLDDGVMYATIKNFQRGSADELAAALAEPGATRRGLVLDLRGNPGGLLDEAVKVVSLFVPQGVVVSTVGAGRTSDLRRCTGAARAATVPLVVLVDERSASASEIVAGALQYHDRALIVGRRSFGKGTVQVPFEIGAGALKLTVAQYLVGGELSIHERGVLPDVAIEFATVLRDRVALATIDGGSEGKQPALRARHRLRVLVPVASQRLAEERASPDLFRQGEPIRRAAELLRRVGQPAASAMAARVSAVVAEMQERDDATLSRALAQLDLDWRRGARDASGRVTLSAVEGSAFAVEAGQALQLAVRIHNPGKRPLFRVHIRTRSDAAALDGVQAAVGRLGALESRVVALRLRPSSQHLDLRAPVTIEAWQDSVPLGGSAEVELAVWGRPRPTLAFRYRLEPPALRPGQPAALHVDVRNEGPGPARDVQLALRSLAGPHLLLEAGNASLGRLEPGEQRTATLRLRGGAHRQERPGLLEALLQLRDEVTGWHRQARLTLAWSAGEADAPADAIVWAQRQSERWNSPPALRFLEGDEIEAPLAEATTPSALDVDSLREERVDASPTAAQVAPLRTSHLARCRWNLRAMARFESGSPASRSVTIHVQGRKRAYFDARGYRSWAVDTPLDLDKGLAKVTISAQAGPDRLASRTLLVHCREAPSAEAPSPAAGPREEGR